MALSRHEGGLQFAIKVVPGATRDDIAGLYGDALKIRVAAPPEGGKANDRVVTILAAALGVATRAVVIQSGHQSPRKMIAVAGLSRSELENRLMVSTVER
ncbi:MAG: DUF167 domain-containing protein [Planctomycetes bacterium]|nr:DUF167 domain-containing protein [Planctomycetota bacterium]